VGAAKMIVRLSKSYPSRDGLPVIDRIDTAIFHVRYFTHCLQCSFCNDWCCRSGVDVDLQNVERINAHAAELEQLTGIPHTEWFEDNVVKDSEFPGGTHTRTMVVDGGCVFLDRRGRGCLLHAYCIERGLDCHELKPIVSSLFPLTFDEGLLHPSDEVSDKSLVCLGAGETLYSGARSDLLWYFGEECLAELDNIELLKPVYARE